MGFTSNFGLSPSADAGSGGFGDVGNTVASIPSLLRDYWALKYGPKQAPRAPTSVPGAQDHAPRGAAPSPAQNAVQSPFTSTTLLVLGALVVGAILFVAKRG